AAAERTAHPPDRIGDPEPDEEDPRHNFHPGPESLDHSYAEEQADQAEQRRCGDVTEAAEQRHPGCAPRPPAPSAGEDSKRHPVVRRQSVKATHACRTEGDCGKEAPAHAGARLTASTRKSRTLATICQIASAG